MNSKLPKIDIKEIIFAVNEARATGRFPATFKMSPNELSETLRELKPKLIEVREIMESMEASADEAARRVTNAVKQIHKDYPHETRFLETLLELKLGSEEFREKLTSLMCELTNAQGGLLDPTKSILVVSRYLDLLIEIHDDRELQTEIREVLNREPPKA